MALHIPREDWRNFEDSCDFHLKYLNAPYFNATIPLQDEERGTKTVWVGIEMHDGAGNLWQTFKVFLQYVDESPDGLGRELKGFMDALAQEPYFIAHDCVFKRILLVRPVKTLYKEDRYKNDDAVVDISNNFLYLLQNQ